MSNTENTQDEKVLWLLNEKNLRGAMRNLYNALRTEKNTEILETSEAPWNINSSEFRGSIESYKGMYEFCQWLEMIKKVTINERIYHEQISKPVQLVAKMMTKIRQMNKKSVNLEGWVFTKSKPTADRYGNLKLAVTVIVPKLQSAMSINIEISEQISRGYYIFKNCQPIALTNRIHQTKSEIKSIKKNILLSEFKFLFTAFGDIKKISNSIEMENFCEVGSGQIDSKRQLGCPFITFGEIISSSGQNIILKDVNTEEMLNVEIADDYYEEINYSSEKFIGKFVRIFGVQWYNTHIRKTNVSKNPEIFIIQEETNIDKLKFENFIGMVRLRGKIDKLKIDNSIIKNIKYNEKYLEILDDSIQFKYLKTNERICNVFIDAEKQIRELREKLKKSEIIIKENDIIDENKKASMLIDNTIGQNKILYDIIMDCQMQIDQTGEYKIDSVKSLVKNLPEEFNENEHIEWRNKVIKTKIKYLKKHKILENGNEMKLTNKGFKMLIDVTSRNLNKKFISKPNYIINLNENNEEIAPSVLLKCLKDGKIEGYKPLKLNGQETYMFWTVGGQIPDNVSEITSKYDEIKSIILKIMNSRSHPATVQMIYDISLEIGKNIKPFIIEILLKEEELSGRIKKDGGSWKYTIKFRIKDMFVRNPDKFFSIEMIFKEINVGGKYIDLVKIILSDLKKHNAIVEIHGEWTSTKNINKKRKRKIKERIKERIRNIILTTRKSKNVIDDNIIIGRIKYEISGNTLSIEERKDLIKEEIDKMILEGIINKKRWNILFEKLKTKI